MTLAAESERPLDAGIGTLKTEADLERFIRSMIERGAIDLTRVNGVVERARLHGLQVVTASGSFGAGDNAITVNWPTAWPDASYNAFIQPDTFGGSSPGAWVGYCMVTAKSTTQMTFYFHARAALFCGFHVMGWRA